MKTTLCNEWQKSQHALPIFEFFPNTPVSLLNVVRKWSQISGNIFGGRWGLQVTF